MIRLCSQKNSWVFEKIKYGLDVLVTSLALFFLCPVLFVIGSIIKMNSPGPALYPGRAVGRGGREFTMYKFRSMKIDNTNSSHKGYVTKLIKDELDEEDKKNGVFKISDDSRVTSVGRFLRKFSLDELPQLINVLKGDMSLVGPRPCLPYEYELYKDWHKKRLSIQPGITCLWQVAGRSAVSFEDMVILDLYYIYNRNLMMDLNILYETVFVVLGKKGAY
ncbi:MAG: sugar transferase [Deltaproteobacteria bacterium]|nr:sugar transferase [Deltaproteobacteria bacterium]